MGKDDGNGGGGLGMEGRWLELRGGEKKVWGKDGMTRGGDSGTNPE